MKKLMRFKVVAAITMVAVALLAVNCGYILHPERKGQETHGKLDVAVLVMDCLWLIGFGIVGVVALIVDFSTGCIYEPATQTGLAPGDRFAFRLPQAAPEDVTVTVTIQDQAGLNVSTLFQQSVAKGVEIGDVAMTIPTDLPHGDYQLTLQVNGDTSAYWYLSL